MNPPFKLSNNKETEFVDYGLRQMKRGGLLFSVLPAVVISGSTYEGWRRELLQRHTLLSCIKFDKNLFYPVTEATYGMVLKAHRPHKSSAPVFMGSLFDDNHRPRKSKLLSDYESVDNLVEMTDTLHGFILDRPVEENIPRQQRVTTLNMDLGCDFSPEGYLLGGSPRVDVAFRAIGIQASQRRAALKHPPISKVLKTAAFPLDSFISKLETAPLKTIKEYQKGRIPVVSATALDNGVADWHIAWRQRS